MSSYPIKKHRIYIVDFFNIFSDYREIKYKKDNVDFHSVKHTNKEVDTINFFDIFFTRYIEFVRIDKKSKFIFIMKKLNGYEKTLEYIICRHKSFDVRFMIIEDKLDNDILDKNKDDFLCQYVFYTLGKTNDCTLISNDRYRDRQKYVTLFDFDISLMVMKWDRRLQNMQKLPVILPVNRSVSSHLVGQKCQRCSIPKHKLTNIL